MKKILFLLLFVSCVSCKNKAEQKEMAQTKADGTPITVKYAKGFSLTDYGDYTVLKVTHPWPNAKGGFTYVLAKKEATIPKELSYDEKITLPIQKMVVTSTTHIPSLESLGETQTLVGFPNLDYISSEATRKRIKQGKIKELGENESINTEILLDLQPDVVIGFAVKSGNKAMNTIQKSGIPVIYNGDWVETNPLGKAEWIKFFGALYGKQAKADSIFNHIEEEYNNAKNIAKKATEKPSVLAGSMYKDVWYLPYGDSWQSKFIADAHANYLYSDTEGSGSISAAFESVLDKGQHADFWIAPGSFSSYDGMLDASQHYKEFKAFQEHKIYSYAGVTGETGGVLYYELAPNRPDLVLKDLIHIFHPTLLPDYQNTFFKPLN